MKGLKVLIIGSGGREDALVYLAGKSSEVSMVYAAPGNAGIAQRPKTICLPIKADNLAGLADFAQAKEIDLTIVGPEAPLVSGIVNGFETRKLRIVGPRASAARLEGSKVFAKNFMKRHKIPTAPFVVFSDQEVSLAKRYVSSSFPCVIKADGLASGKGVILCQTKEEAKLAIERIMVKKEFGEAGNRIVIEGLLKGEEATFMVLTDGNKAIPFLPTQDHKPVFDGDRGPNTGGMGAYAPAPVITQELQNEIMETIIYPVLEGIKKEGSVYKGVLYAGLMITINGPKVLEFNIRFGDPELQPLAMLLEDDIIPILLGVAEEKLLTDKIKWFNGAAVCVVMASEGYPGKPKIGTYIYGLDEANKMGNVRVFYAGVDNKNDNFVTADGRVLGVTARSRKGLATAISFAYTAVYTIAWIGEHHRKDIGQKALIRGY